MEELDCLRTVLLVKVGGGGGGGLRELTIVDGFMTDGLVKAENQKGSVCDDWNFGGREHWGVNTTNDVKQGSSRDTDSFRNSLTQT